MLRDFHRMLDKAGVRRWLLRDLRHGCASLLLAEGASPRTISEILGHSGIGITMDTYAHLAPELKHEAARMMDHALEKGRDRA